MAPRLPDPTGHAIGLPRAVAARPPVPTELHAVLSLSPWSPPAPRTPPPLQCCHSAPDLAHTVLSLIPGRALYPSTGLSLSASPRPSALARPHPHPPAHRLSLTRPLPRPAAHLRCHSGPDPAPTHVLSLTGCPARTLVLSFSRRPRPPTCSHSLCPSTTHLCCHLVGSV